MTTSTASTAAAATTETEPAPTEQTGPTFAATVSARFPLGPGNFVHPVSVEPPSTGGGRPFALRFATPRVAPASVREVVPWRYDEHRQIAVVAATGERYTVRGAGTMETTGPSTDGQGSTGNEEWTPDFAPDGPPSLSTGAAGSAGTGSIGRAPFLAAPAAQ